MTRHRSTNEETQERVDAVKTLLYHGASYTDICRALQKQYGASTRQIARYYKKAKASIKLTPSKRNEQIEMQLAMTNDLIHKAYAKGDSLNHTRLVKTATGLRKEATEFIPEEPQLDLENLTPGMLEGVLLKKHMEDLCGTDLKSFLKEGKRIQKLNEKRAARDKEAREDDTS